MNLSESWKHMWQLFPLKCVGGMVLAGWEEQVWMMLAFFLLVFLDCFTRWLAIASGMLRKEGKQPSLWAMISYLPVARRLGYINSSVMKERGVSKLVLYNLCLLTAGAADFLISIPLLEGKLVDLVVSYLAMTEALSILENLSEAGIKGMETLLTRIKGIRD